ncbi:uncharacterized protein JCM10292_005520, partial [Rhodotorula paludigena]|uniref:uncharacterized protein n=1 Tax=Rhodotorula paludigena TaxID=86838 RepID=UPI00317A42F6
TVVSNVNVMYVANANPTTFHEFATVPGANTILTMSSGTACVDAPDFSTLNMTVGTDVTLLTIYQLYGNETSFYSCADVSLVAASDYTAPSNLACANTAAIFAVASDEDSMVLAGSDWSKAQAGIDGQTVALVAATATNALAAATVTVTPGSLSAASSDSGLSAAAGGGIGAGVTLAVVLALLALGVFSGVVSFGKKRAAARKTAEGSDRASLPEYGSETKQGMH